MFGATIAGFAFFANKLVLVALVLGSFLNVGLYLARRAFFRKHLLRNPRSLLAAIAKATTRTEVVSVLEQHPSEETRIVLQGLLAHPRSAKDFQSAVGGYVETEQVYWDRATGLFAWTSATGPMAGLLGTILGLMKAFSDLAIAELPEPRVALAGIADALLTTVLGILLAIPATAFFNHCKIRTRQARATVASTTLLILSSPGFSCEQPVEEADGTSNPGQ